MKKHAVIALFFIATITSAALAGRVNFLSTCKGHPNKCHYTFNEKTKLWVGYSVKAKKWVKDSPTATGIVKNLRAECK